MAKSFNQKRKLLLLLQLLWEQSDEAHPIPLSELAKQLEAEGVTAERKTLYDDLETLRLHGIDVQLRRRHGYFIGERPFQLAELKLLVDAVQSSKFITEKKSGQLIAKLEQLTSTHEARQLQRQVYVTGRAKTGNEGVYYNIDAIHTAIAQGRQITFRYFDYSMAKEKVFRHGGKLYALSPYALIWDSENYYLVAFDGESGTIRHYRVDKMEGISVTNLPREGRESFSHFDLGLYSRRHFGMFSGPTELVTLRCRASMVGVILDRFGRDVILVPQGEDFFTVTVQVAVSPQFFGWLFGLGDGVELCAPPSAVQTLREQLAQAAVCYQVPPWGSHKTE